MKPILIKDLAEMPKGKDIKQYSIGCMGYPSEDECEECKAKCRFARGVPNNNEKFIGYNSARKEISNLPVSEEKVLGMVELDEEKVKQILIQWPPPIYGYDKTISILTSSAVIKVRK